MNEQDTLGYRTGADFWRDTAIKYGRDEAHIICGNYFSTQMVCKQPEDERQFCRETFAAMYGDAVKHADPAKLVYPYDFNTADERTEVSLYHNSSKQNTACAKAIDAAINASCYETNYYNFELAAMKVISEYGFERVNMVLAKNIHDYDGRFSAANKQWAQGYDVTSKAFDYAIMNAHPILIDSFVNHTKKLYAELDAERHALPGLPESGTLVNGYEIVRSIQFDSDRGFAIGLNPHAGNEFVCWQFTAEDGARDFYWGRYTDSFADAAQSYTARVIYHMDNTDAREVRHDHIKPSREYGIIPNHEPAEKAAEKPSVLKQIRKARSVPKPPPKPKEEQAQSIVTKTKKKNRPEL